MVSDVDIENGVAHFAGNPFTLLRTDPLRIVSFCRAVAESGASADKAAINACRTFAPKLAEIDRKIVYTLMREILDSPTLLPLLILFRDIRILKYLFGFPLSDFSLLAAMEKKETSPCPWQARLIALLLDAPIPPEDALQHLIVFWQLSAADSAYLRDLLDLFPAADPTMPEAEKTTLAEKYDTGFVRGMFLLRNALESTE